MYQSLRKPILFFLALFIVLGWAGLAAGEEAGCIEPSNEVKSCLVQQLFHGQVNDAVGTGLSQKELGKIAGKGLPGVPVGQGKEPAIWGKIILWDEVDQRGMSGLAFGNGGDVLANAQTNRVTVSGP